MKDKYKDNPHGSAPAIIISLGMAPPKGKKGKKGPEEAKVRKGLARQKLSKKGLKKMYDSWSRKTGVAGQYRDELGAFIEGMED